MYIDLLTPLIFFSFWYWTLGQLTFPVFQHPLSLSIYFSLFQITSWFWSYISFDEWFSHLMHLTQSWFVGDIAKILYSLFTYLFIFSNNYLCSPRPHLEFIYFNVYVFPILPLLASQVLSLWFFTLALYSKVSFSSIHYPFIQNI